MTETGCTTCVKQRHVIGWTLGDIGKLRNVLRSSSATAELAERLREKVAERDAQTAELERHQASDECTRVETPTQILDVRRVKGPKRTRDKPRCPVCQHPTSPLPTGYLRKHNDPKGYPCANRRPADAAVLQLDEVPEVVLPPAAAVPRERRAPTARKPLGLARFIDPNYVSTGACNCCGKRVTGERRLCGICAATPPDKRPSLNVPALCDSSQTTVEEG